MSITRNELDTYLQELLNVGDFDDLGPNGLQVEGRPEINKIVTGVSGCVQLFEKAIEKNADAIIVHHGIIWEFERPIYKGSYKKRVKTLLHNEISLFGFHLPLDAHAEFGNNAILANILNLTNKEPFGDFKGSKIGLKGKIDKRAENIFKIIKDKINQHPTIFAYGPEMVDQIGIISGGADKNIKEAVAEGLDMYITGEVSEHIMHYAREEGIHFVAAGHHATERYGIQALGNHLADKFDIEVKFINIPNPV